jgi:hypothetical protein
VAADLATPTATAAAVTPAATPQKQEVAVRILLKGQCVFNLGALATPVAVATPSLNFAHSPAVTKITCGAAGVEVGDIVSARLPVFDTDTAATIDYRALTLRGCSVKTRNQIDCMIAYDGVSALDPGALTLEYVVFR